VMAISSCDRRGLELGFVQDLVVAYMHERQGLVRDPLPPTVRSLLSSVGAAEPYERWQRAELKPARRLWKNVSGWQERLWGGRNWRGRGDGVIWCQFSKNSHISQPSDCRRTGIGTPTLIHIVQHAATAFQMRALSQWTGPRSHSGRHAGGESQPAGHAGTMGYFAGIRACAPGDRDRPFSTSIAQRIKAPFDAFANAMPFVESYRNRGRVRHPGITLFPS